MTGAVQKTRAGRGSLSGAWGARLDGRPNLSGAITLERALPAGSKLWLHGWTRSAAGCEEFVSLVVTVAVGGPRHRRPKRAGPHTEHEREPVGRWRDC